VEDPVFPEGNAPTGVPYSNLRWGYIKDQDPTTAFDLVANHVFPFLREMGGEGSTYAGHMEGARLSIPTPGLLVKVIDMLTDVPMNRRDTSGDLYEYMLGKIASAGQNGQFRTPYRQHRAPRSRGHPPAAREPAGQRDRCCLHVHRHRVRVRGEVPDGRWPRRAATWRIEGQARGPVRRSGGEGSMTTTIAFFNSRAGVGTTTLAYHLSHMFSRLGVTVLAADLDPQSTLTSMFLDESEQEELWDAHSAPREQEVTSPARPVHSPRVDGAHTVADKLRSVLEMLDDPAKQRDFNELDDVGPVHPAQIDSGLWLLPGNIDLSLSRTGSHARGPTRSPASLPRSRRRRRFIGSWRERARVSVRTSPSSTSAPAWTRSAGQRSSEPTTSSCR
jgi:hypothetical protein